MEHFCTPIVEPKLSIIFEYSKFRERQLEYFSISAKATTASTRTDTRPFIAHLWAQNQARASRRPQLTAAKLIFLSLSGDQVEEEEEGASPTEQYY